MLKPIPQEDSGGMNQKKNVLKNRLPRSQNRPDPQKKSSKQMHFMHLKMQLQHLEKIDRGLAATVSRQLTEFLKKAENVTLQELNELIHNLQRTIIGLQKKRIRLMRGQQHKKKKLP